jgi:hypothetical protein
MVHFGFCLTLQLQNLDQYSAVAEYSSDEVWFNIETGGTYFLCLFFVFCFSYRPTAQTRRPICTCDSSKSSVFHSLLAFDILTLKMYDLDRHFQGQRWKKSTFWSKMPPKIEKFELFLVPA